MGFAARLALKNVMQQRVIVSPSVASLLRLSCSSSNNDKKLRLGCQLPKRLSTVTTAAVAGDTNSGNRQIVVVDGGNKSKLSPVTQAQSQRSLLRKNDNDGLIPPLWEFFPSGLGDALLQASENIKRLLETLEDSERIMIKESDKCYKVRYKVPGLAKEDVKITVEDGILVTKEENRKEEQRSSSSEYGYYDTELELPDDAKVDEIKAEMKDGVIYITIPRAEKQNKDVKEVHVQ